MHPDQGDGSEAILSEHAVPSKHAPLAERSPLALLGELSANLTGFCRLLRAAGAGVGPGEQMDALRALEAIGLSDADAFRAALRTSLAKNPDEQALFDALYDRYWMVWDRAGELNRQGREVDKTVVTESPAAPNKPARLSVSDWLRPDDDTELDEEAAGYSPFEVQTHRDFKDFREEEIPALIDIINELSTALATRFSRRYHRVRRQGRLDLRQTLRLSLRRGGELIDLAWRRRRLQRLKLVLICDVSKSMDLYSRFLIQFIFAFQTAYRRIETFVFSTALHHITSHLKRDNLSDVLIDLSGAVPDWSGGTKIGSCLRQLLDENRTLMDRNTVVLIVSDGWDTGDIEILAEAMQEIKQRSRCTIWLNPLMGSPDYEPRCRGMLAALPFIDILASAHNLDSLRAMVRRLGRLQAGKLNFSHPWSESGKARQSDRALTPASAATETATATIDRAAWLGRFGKSE